MGEKNFSQNVTGNSKKGAKKVSVSFRIDAGVVEHNNRDFIAKNVDRARIPLNVVYKNEKLEDKYHELFDKAVEEYNAKQKRADRKISSYYQQIMKSKKERPFLEVIVQIGDMKDCGIGTENFEAAKKCWTNICASLKSAIRI